MIQLIQVLSMIVAFDYASATKYEDPRPITSSIVFDLPTSPNNVFSKEMSNMAFTTFTLNSSSYTNISLGVFHWTSSTRKTTYLLPLQGQWVHVESSSDSLDCSVIYQTKTKILGLIFLNRTFQKFDILGRIPLSFFTSQTVTLDLIRQVILVAETCKAILYTNPFTNESTLYRASADWSTIHAVSKPLDWKPQAYSSDLVYTISNDKIYLYNSTSFQIQLLFTFPKKYSRYTIKSVYKYLIIGAAQTSQKENHSGSINQTNYTIFAFMLAQKMVLLNQFTVDGLLQTAETSYEVITSPRLSKLALIFYDMAGKANLKLKRINFNLQNPTMTFVDIQFKELQRFHKTVFGINVSREFFLGDQFMVVRNGSTLNKLNINSFVLEEAYQFMGNELVLLRDRSLMNSTDNKQLTAFKRTAINFYTSTVLMVLNLYQTANNSYVQQYYYGNIGTFRKIKQQIPPFLTFQNSANYGYFPQDAGLVYVNKFYTQSTNISNFTFTVPKGTSSQVVKTTFTKSGSWQLYYINQQCFIIGTNGTVFGSNVTTNLNISYRLYRLNNSTYTFEEIFDLSPHLKNVTLDYRTTWAVSNDLSRVRIGSLVLIASGSGNFVPAKFEANMTVNGSDSNLTVVIGSDSSLWLFHENVKEFVKLFTLESPLSSQARIRSWKDRILITGYTKSASNTTSWLLVGLVINGNKVVNIFNYSESNKYNTYHPRLIISKDLSNVFIEATIYTANKPPVQYLDLLALDFDNLKVENYSLVEQISGVISSSNRRITLSNSFLYMSSTSIRSYISSNGSTIIFNAYTQRIYKLKLGQRPQILSQASENMTNGATQQFRDAFFHQNSLGIFLIKFYYEISVQPNLIILKARYLGGKPDNSNEKTQGMSFQVQNGQIKTCPVGCSNCQCSSCLQGYVLEPFSLSSCRPCGVACTTCSPNDPTLCLSCMAGAFLNSSSKCQACASECLSCNVSASQCLSCRPSFYFNSSLSTCQPCIKDCFNCSSSEACVTCLKGFVLVGTNMCRACSSLCSQCEPDNITKCISCGKGLTLVNGACTVCPQNCLQCSSSACTICADGYVVGNDGICILKCQFPCINCARNSPTLCTSCPSGSILASNNTCQIDLSCNNNNSCVDCVQGFNYLLIATSTGAYCSLCPNIPNCLQCDSFNSQLCLLCKGSFYVTSQGTCTMCSENCTSCKSETICTGCSAGFTLSAGTTQGSCIKCDSPCLTCAGSPTFCTSCNISTHVRLNSKCLNNVRISFRFVVKDIPQNILKNIDKIVLGLLQILKQNKDNTAAIIINKILSGSTVVTGTVQPSSSTVAAASTLLSEGLKTGIPNTNYTVSESSVVVENSSENTAPSQSTQNSSSSSTKAILLGILIPVAVLIIIGLAIFVYCKRNKETPTTFQEAPIGSSTSLPQGSAKALDRNQDLALVEEKRK